MANASFQNFLKLKVPMSKVPLSKTRGHEISTFQNYRLSNKLLQESGEEIDTIVSNIVQLKIKPFAKFLWEDERQLEFFFTNPILTVWKSTTVHYLHRHKTGTKLLIPPICHRLPLKIKLAASDSVPLFTLLLPYAPPEISENVRFYMLIAVSSWYS